MFRIIAKALLLGAGVYLTAYIIHTPGNQLMLSFIGGMCLGLSANFDVIEKAYEVSR